MQNLDSLLLICYLRFRNSKRLGTVTVRRQRSTANGRRRAFLGKSDALCSVSLSNVFGDPEASMGGKILHFIACLTHTYRDYTIC